MQTLLSFLVALAILIAFHEFGHFWVARRLGVKVLRFSIGFGQPLWRYRKSEADTEFVVAAIPLGGYVKMVDEREGPVEPADLPYAFNRQPLWIRSWVVAAGPLFNSALAVLLFWIVLVSGETGMRPVLGPVKTPSLAADAGFVEGEEIIAVEGETTPTWSLVWTDLQQAATDTGEVRFRVLTRDGDKVERVLRISSQVAARSDALFKAVGFAPWEPTLDPVVEKVLPGSAAERAGLQKGDRLLEADGQALKTWRQWVDYVRVNPGRTLNLKLDRDGVRIALAITPAAEKEQGQVVGKIGAAVHVPPDVDKDMRVEYRLGPVAALGESLRRTYDYSWLTVKMIGRMFVGQAALDNLSGPISIAQYAGQSARLGLIPFFKFLAVVSISLAVLNLLPIPVLDGGHLFFFLIEAVKGSPLSDESMAISQRIGLTVLILLMALALFLDFQRLAG